MNRISCERLAKHNGYGRIGHMQIASSALCGTRLQVILNSARTVLSEDRERALAVGLYRRGGYK